MRIPPNVDFRDYVKVVGELEAQEIHPAGYWRDQVIAMADGEKVSGDVLPWTKTHHLFRMKPGQVTLWAGINGHRKSLVLGQVMLWLAKQKRIAIASLEMFPRETLWRMCLQAAASGSTPSKDYIGRFMDFADRDMLIYDQLDSVPTEKILGFVNYCADELNCKHIVIDSFQKCGIKNDIDKENEFINQLAYYAKHSESHIHLVHHVRKPPQSNPDYKPSKFDIKGSGALTDLVDNVVIIWADKKRQRELEQRELGGEFNQEYLDKTSDQQLIIEKQRHHNWEGFFKLWLHPSGQFTSEEGKPVPLEI